MGVCSKLNDQQGVMYHWLIAALEKLEGSRDMNSLHVKNKNKQRMMFVHLGGWTLAISVFTNPFITLYRS